MDKNDIKITPVNQQDDQNEPQKPWMSNAKIPAIILVQTKGLIAFVKYISSMLLPQHHEGDAIIKENAKLIKKAIKQGRKIEFHYVTPRGTRFESRKIKPTEITFLAPGKNNTRCVTGYCDLRKADRMFTLKRMSDVKILNEN